MIIVIKTQTTRSAAFKSLMCTYLTWRVCFLERWHQTKGWSHFWHRCLTLLMLFYEYFSVTKQKWKKGVKIKYAFLFVVTCQEKIKLSRYYREPTWLLPQKPDTTRTGRVSHTSKDQMQISTQKKVTSQGKMCERLKKKWYSTFILKRGIIADKIRC